MSGAAVRVLIAARDRAFGTRVRDRFDRATDIHLAGEAGTGGEALRALDAGPFDVVLVDLGLRDPDGAVVIRDIVAGDHDVRAVAILLDRDQSEILRAFRAGAAGVLHRDAGSDEIRVAVHAATWGGVFLCPEIAGEIVEAYVRHIESRDAPSDTLTPRQRQVLQMVAEGLTTKAIARDLGRSVKTIESHRAELMRRLGVRQMAGLVREAIRMGLLAPGR